MKKLWILYIPLLLWGILTFTGCKEEKEDMPRLFRPSFIASSCFAEGNKISLAWRISGEPTSYTVELSQDISFESEIEVSQTVTEGKCVFTGLKYETKYYARVRANNEAMNIVSNWTVLETGVTTLSRVIPKLLYAPEENQIKENSAILRWISASSENPVDGLKVWTEEEMMMGADGRLVELSASEVDAGMYELTGLSARTVYYVALTNTRAPEGAEDYNVQRFKTAGMLEGAVLVTDGADLYAKIVDGMKDESKQELVFQLQNGVDYFFNESGASDGKTQVLDLTKSIALLSNPGEHPTLYIREGGFQVGDNPDIDYFIIENVDIEENLSEQSRGSKTYLFGVGKRAEGEDFVIDRFEITNAAVKLPTGVIMMKEKNKGVATINHIRIDNCMVTGINDTKLVTKQFGFIHAPESGADIWNDVSVTNSTFYEFYISPGVFGVLGADVPVSEEDKVSISNCTFYNWATKKSSYTAIGNFEKLPLPINVSVANCVFGYSTGLAFSAGVSNVTTKNNYCTTDFQKATDAGITLVSTDKSDPEFFRNASKGDFTLIDFNSVAYTQGYGDPRWIMVK